jgi:hypothetical protein
MLWSEILERFNLSDSFILSFNQPCFSHAPQFRSDFWLSWIWFPWRQCRTLEEGTRCSSNSIRARRTKKLTNWSKNSCKAKYWQPAHDSPKNKTKIRTAAKQTVPSLYQKSMYSCAMLIPFKFIDYLLSCLSKTGPSNYNASCRLRLGWDWNIDSISKDFWNLHAGTEVDPSHMSTVPFIDKLSEALLTEPTNYASNNTTNT